MLFSDECLRCLWDFSLEDRITGGTFPKRLHQGKAFRGKAKKKIALGGLKHRHHRIIGIMAIQPQEIPTLGGSSMLKYQGLFGLYRPSGSLNANISTHVIQATGPGLYTGYSLMLIGL
jgi:hypothetical protein